MKNKKREQKKSRDLNALAMILANKGGPHKGIYEKKRDRRAWRQELL